MSVLNIVSWSRRSQASRFLRTCGRIDGISCTYSAFRPSRAQAWSHKTSAVPLFRSFASIVPTQSTGSNTQVPPVAETPDVKQRRLQTSTSNATASRGAPDKRVAVAAPAILARITGVLPMVKPDTSCQRKARDLERKSHRKEYEAAVEHLTVDERESTRIYQWALMNAVKTRDHKTAMSLFRDFNKMHPAALRPSAKIRTKLLSLFSVCYRFAHLEAALELREEYEKHHGVLPHQAVLSMIRCHTAVDVPFALRTQHIDRALQLLADIRNAPNTHGTTRLRLYEPVMTAICRTGDVARTLMIMEEMFSLGVPPKDHQLALLLATAANAGPLSKATRQRMSRILEASSEGVLNMSVDLLHRLVAAYEVMEQQPKYEPKQAPTQAKAVLSPSKDAVAGNAEGEKRRSLLSKLKSMLGASASEAAADNNNSSSSNCSRNSSGNTGSKSPSVFDYTSSKGKLMRNKRVYRADDLKDIVAGRGVMINHRRDVPGEIVIDRLAGLQLDWSFSNVWGFMKEGSKGVAVDTVLDEKLPDIAVAINSFLSNPLHTPLFTMRTPEKQLMLMVGKASKNIPESAKFGYHFVSAFELMKERNFQFMNALNAAPPKGRASPGQEEEQEDEEEEEGEAENEEEEEGEGEEALSVTNTVELMGDAVSQLYAEKYFLHETPTEPYTARRRTAKRACMVELSNEGSCPNCGENLRKILITKDEAAAVREALLDESALNSGYASHQKNSALADFNTFLLKHAQENGGQHFTYIVDAANVAYQRQNYEHGKFSFRQIELIVEKLQSIIREQERNPSNTGSAAGLKRPAKILVLLPGTYAHDSMPNMSKRRKGHGREGRNIQKMTPEDEAILERFKKEKMLYLVPHGNDDWFWMLATVNENRNREKNPAYVVTNDLTRDHKSFFPAGNELCFWRWRNSTVMHFDFSRAVEPGVPSPEVMLQEPNGSIITREIQRDGRALDASRLHIPSSDRSSWACISLDSTRHKKPKKNTDFAPVVNLFEDEEADLTVSSATVAPIWDMAERASHNDKKRRESVERKTKSRANKVTVKSKHEK